MRTAREVRSQADVCRVLRGTRSTAGGTPALPEANQPHSRSVGWSAEDGTASRHGL